MSKAFITTSTFRRNYQAKINKNGKLFFLFQKESFPFYKFQMLLGYIFFNDITTPVYTKNNTKRGFQKPIGFYYT